MKWTNRLKMTMLVIQENSDTDKDVMDGVVSAAESLAEKLDALTAERDRLAAENTELKEDAIRDAGIECRLKADIAAANDTLDRLREAVPEGEGRSWSMLDAAYAILYPENET